MNALELMRDVIKEHTPESIWTDSILEGYRHLGNTNRGDIGQDFLERYLNAHGIAAKSHPRAAPTDLSISGVEFEVKTASLGANGSFQFNHIRYDKDYDYLLCLGICPNKIVFGVWWKGAVATGQAGKLVRMAEGQAITFKLTKKLEDPILVPIEVLPTWVEYTMQKR